MNWSFGGGAAHQHIHTTHTCNMNWMLYNKLYGKLKWKKTLFSVRKAEGKGGHKKKKYVKNSSPGARVLW